MYNDLGRTWNESVMAGFEILSYNSPEETEEICGRKSMPSLHV
jgi:hypothetical protein